MKAAPGDPGNHETELLGLPVTFRGPPGTPLGIAVVLKALDSDGQVTYTVGASDLHFVELYGMLRWAEQMLLATLTGENTDDDD